MKKLLGIITSVFFMSCNSDKPICCIEVDLYQDIRYFDNLNRDLLNQDQSYAYDFSEMKHYYLDSHGVKKEVEQQSEYPREMFLHDAPDSSSVLRVFPYIESYESGLRSFTDIIELNSTDSDTIVSEIELTHQIRIVNRIWYNDSLVYTRGIEPGKSYFIRK